ncbi:hypothetical protein [Azohydromonas caseinilytica]|uniref:hypothetical protein n=1 Tax=Azohydromonas caseinilytica TaxID=2728836 RepID=UPI0035BF97CC
MVPLGRPDDRTCFTRSWSELLEAVAGKSVALEELARQMIQREELHAANVGKMLRKPGNMACFVPIAAVAEMAPQGVPGALVADIMLSMDMGELGVSYFSAILVRFA